MYNTYDESGSIAAQFAYDAFGNLLATENSELATLLSLRLSTKYLDPATGFYYYGYRYYDPELGRWLTRDPLEEQGGLNLYGFCGNDAVNKWDLMGLNGVEIVTPDFDGSIISQASDVKEIPVTDGGGMFMFGVKVKRSLSGEICKIKLKVVINYNATAPFFSE